MALAAPAAAVAVPAAGIGLKFSHAGSPNYSVEADIVGLGADPQVHLDGVDHPLVKATSFAPWKDSPVVSPATTSAGNLSHSLFLMLVHHGRRCDAGL